MQNNDPSKETRHALANGRIYKVVDTRRPYQDGEYPTGGFLITVLLPLSQQWSYIDNSPNEECVANFLRAAARLPARPN